MRTTTPAGSLAAAGVVPGFPTAGRVVARGSTALALLGALVIWLALLGPFAVLIQHLSFHSIRAALGPPGALDPLWVSLGASAIALGAMVLLGTPLAYLLARGRLPLARLVELGILLPLMMPPLVIGLLLIFLIGPEGTLGTLLADIHLTGVNTFFALIVAEFYEAAPFYVLGAHAAFASVDPRIEQDATLLGDRPLQAFRRITLPLAAPGLATGLATAWARAMGAFGAVVIIAYYPRGLPNQIFIAFQEFGLSGALPFALLLVVAALPLPVLAYLWSARDTLACRRDRGTVNTAPASLLEVDLEVERRQLTVQAGFGLEAGERLAIFGTSGAGKTTILESIAGLTRLSRGKVRIDGKLVAGKAKGEAALEPRRQAGRPRAPAHDAVPPPHSRAERGVRDPPLPRPRPCRGAARTPRAHRSWPGHAAPLCPVANAERVALGRALASPFRVLLLDEPFSAVDVAAREALRLLMIETSVEQRRSRDPRDPRPHRGAGLRRSARDHRRRPAAATGWGAPSGALPPQSPRGGAGRLWGLCPGALGSRQVVRDPPRSGRPRRCARTRRRPHRDHLVDAPIRATLRMHGGRAFRRTVHHPS